MKHLLAFFAIMVLAICGVSAQQGDVDLLQAQIQALQSQNELLTKQVESLKTTVETLSVRVSGLGDPAVETPVAEEVEEVAPEAVEVFELKQLSEDSTLSENINTLFRSVSAYAYMEIIEEVAEEAVAVAESCEEIAVEMEAVEEEVVEEEIFVNVEQMPTFLGGTLTKFRDWVQNSVKYPQIARENGIQGNVIVKFVIEKDGQLTNIQVLQAPDKTLADATVQVLQKSPRWKPGKHHGEPVRVSYTLPVSFKIN